MNTLFWHDYETWGESPNQDKPSQFAGVRTDENLNIVGEPMSFYCQPASDCLPKPEACLVTGITPQHALEHGLPDYQFMGRIHDELIKPGTCAVGYNSIRFDDEVTRNGLFRNFYDPYEREWNNGNSRWDIIDMVRLTYALRPDGIEWPRNEDGSPSFRLERLSAANGLAHEAAHDALSDVYATIGLARRIREQQPKLYDYAYRMRLKREVASLIDLRSFKPLLHISSKYPAARGCAALVMPLAPHPVNKNGVIVFDLAADPGLLTDLSAEQIAARLFTPRDQLEEGVERVPLKVIHLNKSPLLVTPKLVDAAAEQRLQLDKALCETHWRGLREAAADGQLAGKLQEVFKRNGFPGKSDPEQCLYDGFINDRDKATMAEVRGASPEDLASTTFSFYDERLPELLFRYRARNFPHTLSAPERLQWDEFRSQRFSDPEAGAGITVIEFRERLARLQADPATSSEQQLILEQLARYERELTAGLL
ncbi:exodeoxyribonuclease I [Gilvimarinus sp. F26214L]|uniref:exodeoxyribonuclease I n=1 Tax=Gilvimarinus sp. DZF01 TaxID=3461371 RepID=UPI004045AA1F